MNVAAESSPKVAERGASVRARPDLVAVRQTHQGVVGWVVKNPLSLDYFRLLDEEYFLLTQLDGRRTPAEIQAAFEKWFAPQTIDLAEIERYVGELHRNGLVLSDAAGQAAVLAERGEKRRRSATRERFGSPLALRFRGVDPEPLLRWLYPRVRWFFSSWAVAICCGLMLAAIMVVAGRFARFAAEMTAFHEFFTPSNLVWLGLSLAFVKVLHELGHGLTCKHFGGECHELGFMLLCLTPTMYCNVSDSWLTTSKWRRAAVGAAGMYVELVLASLAVIVWRFAEPGLVRGMALNIVFICSISTLLVNANPLLRYDGYYILGDLLEITNLGGKASAALRRTAGRLCLGLRYDDNDPLLPHRHVGLFAAYALAAAAYRWLVFFGILWFLNKVFEPYRLDFIGHALGTIAVAGLVLAPIRAARRFCSVPGRMQMVDRRRLTKTLVAAGAAILAACFVPLPHRVYAPLEVRPRDAQSVYVEVPGIVEEVYVRAGQRVAAGTPLARLSNIDVEIDVDRLVGRCEEARAVVAALEKERFTDQQADSRMALAEQSLAALERLLDKRRADLDRLILRAPADGVVLPPPELPPESTESGTLPAWSGTPLDAKNLGSTLPAGTMLCRIGDPRRLEAVLVVDQGDVEFAAVDQTVDVRLNELPGRTWRGAICEISKTDLKVAPRHFSNKAGGEVATRTDHEGRERPRSASYQVKVLPLDDPDGVVRIGVGGEAKIYVGTQTPVQLASRAFQQTFNFEW